MSVVDHSQTTARPPVDLAQLRQVADELDDGAVSPPCSEAEVVRDAAAEIERLRAAHANGRWNIAEHEDGAISICRGHHDKGDACYWERFNPS